MYSSCVFGSAENMGFQIIHLPLLSKLALEDFEPDPLLQASTPSFEHDLLDLCDHLSATLTPFGRAF